MSHDRSGELPTEREDTGHDDEPTQVFVVTVVEGPESGASVTLDPASPARALVGTGATCTLRLSGTEISRRHASMRPEGRALVIADLGSTNGTHVNGVSVREASLSGGEVIRLGRTVLTVARGSPLYVALSEERGFGRLLGTSRAMRRLYPILHRVAASDHPLLLEGEAGVGKELCAEEIHAHSARASRPFLVLSCQTLSARAIEERLFGEDGWLATPSGGTVYIDEVAALPVLLQRRLAVMLARGEPSGVRLLFGTRRNLDQDVADGSFREELLERLAPVRIELPPLRDRAGDVPLLANAFWSTIAAADPSAASTPLPPDFLARFHRYRWPGNIRELSAAVFARYNMGELARFRPADVGPGERDYLRAVVDRELPLPEARQLVVDELERRYIDHMLARHGNSRDAARASGVGLRYFQLLRARLES
jgi:DNA-binding NtrC family response regulator